MGRHFRCLRSLIFLGNNQDDDNDDHHQQNNDAAHHCPAGELGSQGGNPIRPLEGGVAVRAFGNIGGDLGFAGRAFQIAHFILSMIKDS
jgi:hypothetical protein